MNDLFGFIIPFNCRDFLYYNDKKYDNVDIVEGNICENTIFSAFFEQYDF